MVPVKRTLYTCPLDFYRIRITCYYTFIPQSDYKNYLYFYQHYL